MTLRLKERELVAVGVSLAAGCKPCTDYHFKAAREAKCGEAELRRAVEVGLDLRRRAVDVMTSFGLQHLGDEVAPLDMVPEQTTRIDELVAIGAALAVNCPTSLAHHLAAAERFDISEAEIADIAKLAIFIKGKAAAHAEKLVVAEPPAEVEAVA